ncbi:hypothetical protein LINGRAHAP2_LOCUS27232 [Linum grandiflorum]
MDAHHLSFTGMLKLAVSISTTTWNQGYLISD